MAQHYSPRIVQDGLVMCLDPSQNKSYPTTDLPVKGGLLLWLDAADDTTFSYSSGTQVSQWRDKSGNNFHANQSTTTQQPLRNTTNNSRKSVFFNASTRLDFMTISSGISLPNDASIFIIYKPATQIYNYAVLIDNYHGLGGAYGFVIQRVNNLSQFYYANGNGSTFVDASASPWTYTDNVIQLSSLNKSSSTATPYISGTAQTSRTVFADTAQYTTGLAIGYWGNGGGRFYNGDMCEILIFNRSLSSAEMKQVHTYLGQKWGISNTDRSIIDLSGFNDNGLLGNGATADMPLFDYYNKGALRLDGSTDYIAVADSAALSPSTVTVSLWIKRNNYQSSITNFLRRNDFDSYALMATNNADTVWFRIRNSVPAVVDAQTSMPLNTWVNLVGTFDGSNVRIYKDGAFANIAANTSPISYAASNSTMIIGRDDAVSGRYAPVSYGSILIYNRALSAAEIAQNYEAQKSKFANTIVQQGLVLNLDAGNPYSYAGAGSAWYDVSGNNLVFNSQGATQTPFTTIGGSPCFDFNGSGYWECGTNFNLVDLGGDCTIIMWFYCETTAARKTIFEKAGTSYQSYQQEIAVTWEVANDFSYYSRFSPDYDFASTAANTVNAWNMVGIKMSTGKTTAARTGFYSKNGSAWTSLYTSRSNTALVAAGAIRVGSGYAGTVTDGYISSVLCYNRMLTDAEILQNYNATKSKFGL